MRALPSPQQLRYFVAVADELNFGRAARRCHVSQSTISGAIGDLEDLLGTRLLERSKRHVALTREGASMAVHARDILQRLEAVSDLARSLQGPLSGGLRLGIIPTIAPFLLPDLLLKLREQFPDLSAKITEDLTPVLLEKIADGSIDCAVLALPYQLGEVMVRTLFKDRLLVAHARETVLETTAKGVTSATLRRENVLLLNDGHCLKDQALSACKLKPEEITTSFQAASLVSLLEMVGRGMGVTFVPELAVDWLREHRSRLQLTPLAENTAVREIALCWRRNSHRQGDFDLIAEMLEKLRPTRKKS